MPYYVNLIASGVVLSYLLFKLFAKGINDWKFESRIIKLKQSEKFLALNIINENDNNNLLIDESKSFESFSVGSEQRKKHISPFEIEENSNEDDSNHMINGLKIPDDLSIEQSENIRKVYDDVGLLSDRSSLNEVQRKRFNEQQSVLNSEKSHFECHSTLFILKSMTVAMHWFYRSRNDPLPYSNCDSEKYSDKAVT